MVQINFARKEINCKIVYYGPGLSGKTTNLEMVHEKAPTGSKGELTSISTDGDRTLFFDFMPLDLGSIAGMQTKFHIYTVPGQVYYNSTRKLVLLGADGLIFVADSSPEGMEANKQSLENLKENLAEMGKDIAKMPLVMQYNKRDMENPMSLERMESELNIYKAPSLEAVASKGEGVIHTLKTISSLVLESINANERKTSSVLTSPVEAPTAVANPPEPIQVQTKAPEESLEVAPQATVEQPVQQESLVGATAGGGQPGQESSAAWDGLQIERNQIPNSGSQPVEMNSAPPVQEQPQATIPEQQPAQQQWSDSEVVGSSAPPQAEPVHQQPVPPSASTAAPPMESKMTIETGQVQQPVQPKPKPAPSKAPMPQTQGVASRKTEQQAKTNALLNEQPKRMQRPTPTAAGGRPEARVIGGAPKGKKKSSGNAVKVVVIVCVTLLLIGAGVAYYLMM